MLEKCLDKASMRSEHMSPKQLWTSGLQRIAGSRNIIAKEVFETLRVVNLQELTSLGYSQIVIKSCNISVSICYTKCDILRVLAHSNTRAPLN